MAWAPEIPPALRERAERVRLLVLDVDGVLTDGGLFYGDDGQEYKRFHCRDGHGLKMLMASGVAVAVITGRTSHVVAHRMADLGVDTVHQGQVEKLPAFESVLAEYDLGPEQAAFVGDDVVDLPMLGRVGLAVAVADAHPAILENVHWQTRLPGGEGAVREVCDLLMGAQGTLEAQLAAYRTAPAYG